MCSGANEKHHKKPHSRFPKLRFWFLPKNDVPSNVVASDMPPTIHKLNGFRHRSKVAAFDFDWTLVHPKDGRKFPKDADDWEWLREIVPEIIKEQYKKGFCIIIFTNQTKAWKQEQIINALSTLGIPVLIAIAMDKAEHKPAKTLWETAVGKRKVNMAESFFVGDALGRPSDWSNTDLLFAQAIGIKAISPETMFPLPTVEHVRIKTKSEQEMVVMVGYPGSGKTSVVKQLLESSPKYVHIDGDALKTPAKMVKQAKDALLNGKSPIIDSTNPTKAGREKFIDLAKEANASVRCVWVTTSMQDAMARNANRHDRGKPAVPQIVYYVYRKKFEKPIVSEGFAEVIEY